MNRLRTLNARSRFANATTDGPSGLPLNSNICSSRIAAGYLVALVCLAGCGDSSETSSGSARSGWPTEDEVKAAVLKVEYDIRASETNKSVWHVKDLRHEVQSVQFGQQTTQKQMNYGAAAITVYPVKVLYTRITEYTDKPATHEPAGNDGVWFFYKDSFGNWTAKYGNE